MEECWLGFNIHTTPQVSIALQLLLYNFTRVFTINRRSLGSVIFTPDFFFDSLCFQANSDFVIANAPLMFPDVGSNWKSIATTIRVAAVDQTHMYMCVVCVFFSSSGSVRFSVLLFLRRCVRVSYFAFKRRQPDDRLDR